MIGAVIVAAGTSSRMSGLDKQFALLSGRPVLAHTVGAFEALPEVDAIAVVVNPATAAAVRALGAAAGWRKVVAFPPGGARRQDSCANGLAALAAATPPGALDVVLVHDGARPLVSAALIRRGIAAARAHGAAIPGVPARDTVKVVAPDGRIVETPDRSRLRLVQTPQVFRYALLAGAYAAAAARDLAVTDDAALLEALGQQVYVFEGEPRNLKITTPEDLIVAAALLHAANGVKPDT